MLAHSVRRRRNYTVFSESTKAHDAIVRYFQIPTLKIQAKKTTTPKKKTAPTDEDRKSWPRIWSDSADCLRWGKAADKAESALQKLMDIQEEFRNEYKKMSKTDRDSV